MNDPQAAAEALEQAFDRIHKEDMAGIPLLNPALKVQTLGFREYQGRIIGVLITPWMMNLVMLPGRQDDWSRLEVGKKLLHEFPSNTRRFMVNEIDGIGKCQTHSLFSPMGEFFNQDHAVGAAQNHLDCLMTDADRRDADPVDAELLGRILRGEETPEIDLDQFEDPAAVEPDLQPVRGASSMTVRVEKRLSRRDLLRGNIRRDV
ncbi:MAG: [NiFe]-hydrogenase assembly chaperone HybE [Sulfitobacter sp.]|nr:[NiFe]-hydrogenase assembly chaperone HybE [Sulfitobacter sp.]